MNRTALMIAAALFLAPAAAPQEDERTGIKVRPRSAVSETLELRCRERVTGRLKVLDENEFVPLDFLMERVLTEGPAKGAGRFVCRTERFRFLVPTREGFRPIYDSADPSLTGDARSLVRFRTFFGPFLAESGRGELSAEGDGVKPAFAYAGTPLRDARRAYDELLARQPTPPSRGKKKTEFHDSMSPLFTPAWMSAALGVSRDIVHPPTRVSEGLAWKRTVVYPAPVIGPVELTYELKAEKAGPDGVEIAYRAAPASAAELPERDGVRPRGCAIEGRAVYSPEAARFVRHFEKRTVTFGYPALEDGEPVEVKGSQTTETTIEVAAKGS